MRYKTRLPSLGLGVLVTLALASAELPAEETSRKGAEVLVLGVYHMSNPGRDVFNTEADDVFSARRQAELAELAETLARFQPTKIAVEADFSDKRVGERYAAYLAGEHELSRNETEQIGFRLARRLGHATVYPVDAAGEFPYLRLIKFAEATGRKGEFEAMHEAIGRRVEAQNAYLASHSVLETLLYMNSAESVEASVGAYFQYLTFGEPWDWAGADLISSWFRRNMRIASNIVQLIDSAEERILVVYGAGHLGWLRQAIEADPDLRLRTLADLVE